jgi:hypothetical protein
MIVSDNGTELTCNAIIKWSEENGVEWHYIGPHPMNLSITHKSEPFKGHRQRRNVESEESLVIHC